MKLTQLCFSPSLAMFILISLAAGCATQKQATFPSPNDAVDAMVKASRAHDTSALHHIFGPDGDSLISSGDKVADNNALDRFVSSYDEKHQLVPSGSGNMTLVLGKNDWPMPIPLVQAEAQSRWRFDTAAGKDEILNRRVGNNELAAMQICQAIVDAQIEYAQRDPDGDGVPEYAQRFHSELGKKNGLYWETKAGEPDSPLGPLVTDAAEESYTHVPSPRSQPYHGYYFHILKSQGPHAPGGAMDYIINGNMVGGFGLIAYPADYGNSGVMTFLTNHTGVIYQQDLGDDTEKTAKAIKSYDPGPGWTVVDEKK
ncbi:MAG TPA: DUF2950 domain-containing protein [Tepidisphaeraceae bacterium]|jgi:hypothetical protein|nr:DUF2950 domain-containing protein [Tepidisphaeraceae bacterium]